MTKSKDSILLKMNDVFKKSFSVNQNFASELESDYDNTDNIKKSCSELLKSIQDGKIPHIEYLGTNVDDTLNDMVDSFPIGLVKLSPIDFEGEDPLDIDELINTGLLFLFEYIQKREIKGLHFYI